MTADDKWAICDYFAAILPADAAGWLIIAIGRDPYLDERGKYHHQHWSEHPYHWPDTADSAVAKIGRAALLGDVYV